MSKLMRLLGTGLLLGSIGCADQRDDDQGAEEGVVQPDTGPDVPTAAALASLQRADDCPDLLTKVQDDAIAKLKLVVQREKLRYAMQGVSVGGSGGGTGGIFVDAGSAGPTKESAGKPSGNTGSGSAPTPSAPPVLSEPARDADNAGSGESGGDPQSGGPIASSDTNRQVADVDEADFVKVVESGKGIFLLHGNTLQKLKSWPASETARVGTPVTIEGTPSEMFVSDDGKAVVFSSVYGLPSAANVGTPEKPNDSYCDPYSCKGASQALKITVVDVSGAAPVVQRELYYEGNYVSSRRYDAADSDVVRTVIQSYSKFSGLFSPNIESYDAWGEPYEQSVIDEQLDDWAARNIVSIRKTTLDDWLPVAHELKDKQLVALAPACGDYFVPTPGLADYGLTQVVSLDLKQPAQQARTLTIVGATSTVYSNSERLVLAQPDYRWGSTQGDFGIASEQQTALHVFSLSPTDTAYLASGWVPGVLPQRNPQFGIDVAADGTVRVATTGLVRDQPTLMPTEPGFWGQHTDNRVVTARVDGNQVKVVGKSEPLGHKGESVYSARFVGSRAYVVTFRQTDPLIVVDVSNPASLPVLGQIEIPGFSEYMHPLDDNHIVTLGQGASWGIQLQLFDVSNPSVKIPAPKVLEFGQGSSSPVSYSHKALTVFEGVLAIPVSGQGYDPNTGYGMYKSSLELVRVDANTGFTKLASIDHAPLYADNGAGVSCGRCDLGGCYDYYCGYAPEVTRGVFVKGSEGTFVYSFSYAGVLVNDLAKPELPVARVGLPAPVFNGYGPWYGNSGGAIDLPKPTPGGGFVTTRDAGTSAVPSDAAVVVTPPSMGAVDGGVATAP
jgi:hypothetical protein